MTGHGSGAAIVHDLAVGSPGADARPPVDEGVLVRAACDGDLEAFERLVQRHQDAVYAVALRMLRSPADAQDAAQDAFVQAWKALSRFRADSSFGTWMYRIVTNRCLNVIAARRPEQPLPDRLTSKTGDPAATAEGRERTQALLDTVHDLPAEQRVAIVLRELQGLSYEEIGAVLEISPAAVKGRIHRARLTVIERMGQWR